MIRTITVAVAVLAAATLIVSGAMAQSKPAQPTMEQKAQTDPKAPPAGEQPKMDKQAQRVEGTIKSVDAKGNVTLEDGTKLMIPKSVTVPKGALKPGAAITAEYEQKGTQKVATSVQIKG